MCGGSKGSNTTTTTSAPPPEIMDAYRRVMERAEGVADTPYTAYKDAPLTTGLSNSQNQAAGVYGNVAEWISPHFSQAAAYAQPNKFSAEAVGKFLSPYTQNVIDTTMSNIRRENQIQASDLTSQGIKSGNAFGGDRLGLAQAELARGQAMSRDATIAGLWDKNYSQALGQFNQENQQKQQAASLFNQLGTGWGNLLLNQGAGLANIGAQEQATEQARLTALYNQWQQQQAFPYQQVQWLSGIQSGLGSLSGGSSSTTSPGPNMASQILGFGTAALGFLSDERAKEDIREVGKTHDGQKIYSYRYKGDPRTQIGLLAQEVEEDHPEAVHEGFGGLKHVDYREATRSAERATGGAVAPYSEGLGWIPQIETKRGAGVGIPSPHKGAPDGAPSMKEMEGFGKAAGNAFRSAGSPTDLTASGMGFAPSGLGASSLGMDITAGLGPIYRRGGAVPRRVSGFGMGGVHRASGGSVFEDRLRDVEDAIADGTFDPQGDNYTTFRPGLGVGDVAPAREVVVAEAPSNVVPLRRGLDVNRDELPPEIVGRRAPASVSQGVMAYDEPREMRGTGTDGPVYQSEGFGGVAPQSSQGPSGGLREAFSAGLIPMTPEVRAALITAGLGMMASRSPNIGNAIGEGGLAGLNAYSSAQAAARKAAEDARKAAMDEKRLGFDERRLGFEDRRLRNEDRRLDSAERDAQRARETGQFIPDGKGGYMVNPVWVAGKKAEADAKRNDTAPSGYRYNDKGELEYIPGGPQDPKRIEEVKRIEAAARAKDPNGKSLPTNAIKALEASGSAYTDFARLSETWNDGFGGYYGSETAGDLANWMGRNIPGVDGTGAVWWQDYQSQKNIIRNKMFGSALTATEKTEFDKANIHPGMKPDVIRTNLQRQKDAAERAARKLAAAHVKSGYNPDAVEAAVGVPLSEIGAGESRGIAESTKKSQERATDAPKKGDRKQFKQGWGVWDGSKWVPE